MTEYRERTTGEVKSKAAWRAEFANTALPSVWKPATLDGLNLDPVLETAPIAASDTQIAVRDGVEQNDNGKWIQKWILQDMFADVVDEEGNVVVTKAEREAANQAMLDTNAAGANRATRDRKLAETDFYALSDVTMSAEMTTYRQALRDITTHANWPNLEEADWPTKPE